MRLAGLEVRGTLNADRFVEGAFLVFGAAPLADYQHGSDTEDHDEAGHERPRRHELPHLGTVGDSL